MRYRFACRAAHGLAVALALALAPMTQARDAVPAGPSEAAAGVRDFDLPAQPLAGMLREIGRRTGTNILFEPRLVGGLQAPALRGRYTAGQALQQLLRGTALTMQRTSADTLVVRAVVPGPAGTEHDAAPQEDVPAPQDPDAQAPVRNGEAGDGARVPSVAADTTQMADVVVTGTRIRGAEQASPMLTITQDDMRLQGHTDLGQVARALPQNFSGGQNPGIAVNAGGIGNQNISGSSSINLRGLGQDATLTLLNGTRLPYDGFTQATDVASIPIAAIDRMDVLLDGASAIYGSDAVGGVVNVVLKRDYEGAEVSTRWGKATEGGFLQRQFTGVAGTTWSGGGFLVSADRSRNSSITAGQRDYLRNMPGDTAVFPASTQTGFLLSGHQQLGERAELTVDAFRTRRHGEQFDDFSTLFGYSNELRRRSTLWGIAPALRFDLPGEWSLKLGGTLGRNEAVLHQTGTTPDGEILYDDRRCYCNDAKSAYVDGEGPAFALPAGDVRFAAGGGYRENRFRSVVLPEGRTKDDGRDRSRFLYGEVYVPVVSPQQDIPFVNELSVSGAVRHEDYDSFGRTTTPKLGVVWGLTRDLEFKATWGQSFKAPTLMQRYQPAIVDLFPTAVVGGIDYPPDAGVLFLQGGNRTLTPERARTFTAGLAFHPEALRGLSLGLNGFDIDYTDRVVQPFNPLQSALVDPAGFQFVTFRPTPDQQAALFRLAGVPIGSFYQGVPPPPLGPYDPARIVAIVDMRYVNSAAQHVRGVDLGASYATDLFGGSFALKADATWMTTRQKLTVLAQEALVSGYVFSPPGRRWRLGGTWSRDRLSLAATASWTDGVKNNLFDDPAKGGSFTTVDVVLDYALPSNAYLGELQFDVGVQNLFDRRPPYMRTLDETDPTYDSTNYPALGRVVNVTLTKRF